MNYSGGISIYVHLVINFYSSVIKKYPKKIASALIVMSVAITLFINGRGAVVDSWNKRPKPAPVAQEENFVCEPVRQEDSGKKIILRLDDVQAFAFSEVSQKIIEDAGRYNMKMVLGVIPHNISQDVFFDKILKKHRCNLELALHGWDHSYSEEDGKFEFENMDENEASEKINQGKKDLESISGQPVVTFVPPGNKISESTKKVLDEAGIKYLSGDNESSDFGMDATTFDFPNKKLVENEEIIKKCDARFKKKKPCIIVIHPQDYLTDDQLESEKYEKFQFLLQSLREENIYSTTFSEL